MVGQRHDQHAVAVVRLASVECVLHKGLGRRRVPPLDVRLVHAAVVAVEGDVEDADHVAFVGDDGALVIPGRHKTKKWVSFVQDLRHDTHHRHSNSLVTHAPNPVLGIVIT